MQKYCTEDIDVCTVKENKMELPKYLVDKCMDVIVGNLSIEQFEMWVYQQEELIDQMYLNEFYFLLLEFNYKQKGVMFQFKKLLEERINPLSYQTSYVLKSLEQLSKNNGDLLPILAYLHELHHYEDVKFLKSIGNCFYVVEDYIEYNIALPAKLLDFIQTESIFVLEELRSKIDQEQFIKSINFETNEPPSFWSYETKRE